MTTRVEPKGAAPAGPEPGLAHGRPRGRFLRRESLAAYFFVAPALIHSLVFIVGVVIVSAVVSTTRWDLITPPSFIGLDNYVHMFQDDLFWTSITNTVIFAAVSVPTSIGLSLALALAANTKLRGMTFFRTAYFFPYIASMVSVAIVFRWLFSSADYGLINAFLGLFGIKPVNWLGQCSTALPTVALVSVWKGLGWNMTLFLAGLQGIPAHLYEAAELDGAGPWQRFRDVTWPLLSPTTFFVSITAMLGFFQTFDSVYLMTGGGPSNCTLLYLNYTVRQGFNFFHMGYAAAMSWFLFAVLAIATFIQFKVLNKRVHYELG